MVSGRMGCRGDIRGEGLGGALASSGVHWGGGAAMWPVSLSLVHWRGVFAVRAVSPHPPSPPPTHPRHPPHPSYPSERLGVFCTVVYHTGVHLGVLLGVFQSGVKTGVMQVSGVRLSLLHFPGV
ncbi:hypothetical protein E2C01_087516 [Portunus trituberculatus]|uniref:Uncharacterized protein n=1 Tax=Portunus trituberculatus TaxID=210409 RepID=A0A5B7JGK0_PORTR|nr:hypothetical protein [Portunus trituberculatus]